MRAGIVGIELERAAAGGDRFVDAAGEPAHLAEIGVIERDIRLDRDGAAQMLDRFVELAGLMRDDAEHVRGLGVVRLRRRRRGASSSSASARKPWRRFCSARMSAWPGGIGLR